MVKLLDFPFWDSVQEKPLKVFLSEEAPELDISMPRVFRRPPAPRFTRGKSPVSSLVKKARDAFRTEDLFGFGQAYGELLTEFQPALRWAISCWDYLLSTEGCRFLPRSLEEKRYCRGDYRVFTEEDFRRHVYRAFKDSLLQYLKGPCPFSFEGYVRQTLWPAIAKSYRDLAHPPDPRQRLLTGYSYLRCVPYRFLNGYHQERVYSEVGRLPDKERQVVELYYLHFFKEEAVVNTLQISWHAFRCRRSRALKALAGSDYLSYILLTQIERY